MFKTSNASRNPLKQTVTRRNKNKNSSLTTSSNSLFRRGAHQHHQGQLILSTPLLQHQTHINNSASSTSIITSQPDSQSDKNNSDSPQIENQNNNNNVKNNFYFNNNNNNNLTGIAVPSLFQQYQSFADSLARLASHLRNRENYDDDDLLEENQNDNYNSNDYNLVSRSKINSRQVDNEQDDDEFESELGYFADHRNKKSSSQSSPKNNIMMGIRRGNAKFSFAGEDDLYFFEQRQQPQTIQKEKLLIFSGRNNNNQNLERDDDAEDDEEFRQNRLLTSQRGDENHDDLVNSNRMKFMLQEQYRFSPLHHFQRDTNKKSSDLIFNSIANLGHYSSAQMPSSSQQKPRSIVKPTKQDAIFKNLLVSATNQLSLIPSVAVLSEKEKNNLETIGEKLAAMMITMTTQFNNNDNNTNNTNNINPTLHFTQATLLYEKMEKSYCVSRCPTLSKVLTKILSSSLKQRKHSPNAKNILSRTALYKISNSSSSTITASSETVKTPNADVENHQEELLHQQRKVTSVSNQSDDANKNKGQHNNEDVTMNKLATEKERKRQEFNKKELDRIRAEKFQKRLEQQLQEEQLLRLHAGDHSFHQFSSGKKNNNNNNNSKSSKNDDNNASGKSNSNTSMNLIPSFVQEMRQSKSFFDVLKALNLTYDQVVASQIQNDSIHNNNNNKINAETFDSGSRFLPLDVISVFSSNFNRYSTNNATEKQHQQQNVKLLGKQLIKRFVSMQTNAINKHFSSSSSSSVSGNNSVPTFILNAEAATESSLILADMLLQHCDAPTLTTQLLNTSRPLFESFIFGENSSNNNINNNANQTVAQKNDKTTEITVKNFQTRLASLRIRAACSLQPPNWKLALEQSRSLPNLSTIVENEIDNNNNHHHVGNKETYSALQVLLSTIPPQSLTPTQWLEMSRRFFAVPDSATSTISNLKTKESGGDDVEEKAFEEANDDDEQDGDCETRDLGQDDVISIGKVNSQISSLAFEPTQLFTTKGDSKTTKTKSRTFLETHLPKSDKKIIINNKTQEQGKIVSALKSQNSQSFPSTAFQQFCRVLLRSVEVHHSKANAILLQQQNNHHDSNNNVDAKVGSASLNNANAILESLTSFVNLYRPHLIANCPPYLTSQVFSLLVSVISSKKYFHQNEQNTSSSSRSSRVVHDSPTNSQREAVLAANSLLGPLLRICGNSAMNNSNNNNNAHNAKTHLNTSLALLHLSQSESLSSSSLSPLSPTTTSQENVFFFQPTRSLTMAVGSLVSKCGLVGMWADALSILSTEFSGTRRIADTRTWSCIAHAAHRPHPANWEAALVATKFAIQSGGFGGGNPTATITTTTTTSEPNSVSSSENFSCSHHHFSPTGSTCGDLDDVTEAATAALISLANSDLPYSKRAELALQVFTRVRSLRSGDDELGTTKRMIGAAVDALTMRMPTSASLPSSSVFAPTKNPHAMSRGLWSRATELFSNFVQTRAVDVTSSSKWLRNHIATSSERQQYKINNNTNNNSHNNHRDTDATWRGRFAGKGRLGDDQRLATSLVRALSNQQSWESQTITRNNQSTSSSPSCSSHEQQHQHQQQESLESENFNTAMMLCGGDASALLRATAECGAWHCALTTLNLLLLTSSSSSSTSPVSSSSSFLFPSTTSLGEKKRGIENAALACLWAPNVAAYLSLQRTFPNAHLPPLLSAEGEKNEEFGGTKKSYISSDHQDPDCDKERIISMSSEKGRNEQDAVFRKLDVEFSWLAAASAQSKKNKNVYGERYKTSNLHKRAQPKTVASYEKQEIIDLTEKIYLMRVMEKETK